MFVVVITNSAGFFNIFAQINLPTKFKELKSMNFILIYISRILFFLKVGYVSFRFESMFCSSFRHEEHCLKLFLK